MHKKYNQRSGKLILVNWVDTAVIPVYKSMYQSKKKKYFMQISYSSYRPYSLGLFYNTDLQPVKR